MAFSCKGICDSLMEEPVPSGLRYKLGQKRCTLCGIFVKTTNLRCPCCNARLRTRSRNKKHSRKRIH
nr:MULTISPECIES: hypothetical protein [Nitrosopumilus]